MLVDQPADHLSPIWNVCHDRRKDVRFFGGKVVLKIGPVERQYPIDLLHTVSRPRRPRARGSAQDQLLGQDQAIMMLTGKRNQAVVSFHVWVWLEPRLKLDSVQR